MQQRREATFAWGRPCGGRAPEGTCFEGDGRLGDRLWLPGALQRKGDAGKVKRRWISGLLLAGMCFLLCHRAQAEESAAEALTVLRAEYEAYQQRFQAIETLEDIEEQNYEVIEDQSFPVALETFGEEEVYFYSVLEKRYHRLAVLVTDGEGKVLYKTNQLEANYKHLGRLEQPVCGLAAVSFQDLDRDGLTDILLIADCENGEGSYAGKRYKVGDVLFQRDGGFYRDWRISDKLNRFGMNKSADVIAAYVRDGSSTEALYTAVTLEELLDSGFQVIKEQNYYRQFEKQGYLQIVPGVMRMAEYDVFMIFLVNEEGYIVWSFQPMGDYDNLYAMRGMICEDMDGDGMKDIVVLAKYSYFGESGERLVDTKCSIYYQRTDGFVEDREFGSVHQCTEDDTIKELVKIIREYWGWPKEE